MALGREDAARVVKFCLAGSGWGSAAHDGDLCVVRIAPNGPGVETQRFEGETFELALRRAAEAGFLKSVCLEKQIAFLARALPGHNGGDASPWRRIADGDDGGVESLAEGAGPDEPLFPSVTSVISALIHETQRERGASSLFLSSGGRLFARELRQQWRSTDARRADLLMLRQRCGMDSLWALSSHLDRAQELLRGLSAWRGDIESLRATPNQAIDLYSAANSELLSVIDDLVAKDTDITVRSTALAWMALLHAKERTGIERAQLANAFAWDRYVDGQHAKVSALIAASESYLHVFAAAAPRRASELLRKKLRTDVVSAVSEMEQVALSKRDGGFGIDPTTWFTNITRKMDLLGEIESAVRASIAHRRAA